MIETLFMIERLTKENYLIYAMKHYDNPACESIDEFYKDLARVDYIKKLIRRMSKEQVNIQLLLNHFIILNNVFGAEATARLLFFLLTDEVYVQVKTILIYLSLYPESKTTPEGVDLVSIAIDNELANKLRNL